MSNNIYKIIKNEKKVIVERDGIHYHEKEIEKETIEAYVGDFFEKEGIATIINTLIEIDKRANHKNISYKLEKINEEDFNLGNFNRIMNGEEKIKVISIHYFIKEYTQKLLDNRNVNEEFKKKLAELKSSDNTVYMNIIAENIHKKLFEKNTNEKNKNRV